MNRCLHAILAGAFALLAGSGPCAVRAEQATPLPGDSLYQLDIPLTDQRGRDFRLPDLRGRVQVVAMFYTSCRYVCPLIIDTIRHIERAVPAERRIGFDVLLVSFDPARDDVAALASVASRRGLDTARWRLVRTDDGNVRSLAAALGIQYRRLADGEYNHASLVTLLDVDGRIRAQTGKLGEADPEFVAALDRLLDR